MRNRAAKSVFWVLLSIFLFNLLFSVLYRYDNKYTHVQASGNNGVLTLTEADLQEPLFLIDGWMLSVDGGPETETFIGQYSNYSYAPGGTSPFGTGVYRLTIVNEGAPQVVTLSLPEVFTSSQLTVNGELVPEKSRAVGFLADERTDLQWTVTNDHHYYSGLYYPPTLGTAADMTHLQFERDLVYGILCISSLTLAIYAAVLWVRRNQDALFHHFGLLCLFFGISCLHPFAWQLGLCNSLCYAVEDGARLMVWVQALALSGEAAGLGKKRWARMLYRFMLAGVGCSFLTVAVLIPHFPELIALHGGAVDLLTIACWLAFAVFTSIGLTAEHSRESGFSLVGCCALGAALYANLLDNNAFEPIRTAWQGEWMGFLLVIIFGCLMIWHNTQLLRENRQLTNHLEELVEERTSQLNAVIEERKRFFSDMAHNLKAPVAAIHGYTTLLRGGGVGVDDELLGYITLIETETVEMRRRIQALNTLNAFDRIESPKKPISVNELLRQVADLNTPEAEVAGIRLTTGQLEQDAIVVAQEEKLLTLFENLIYNAISFTPLNGSITIVPGWEQEGQVTIRVKDTGCGIPEEKLPYVFDRFYVGRENSEEGSGLGLYIARLTVEELGGTICAESQVGAGSEFIIRLPASEG